MRLQCSDCSYCDFNYDGEKERPHYFCKLKNEEVESDGICNWFKQFKQKRIRCANERVQYL